MTYNSYYVYAYDVYGARTYFIASNIPQYIMRRHGGVEQYLTKIAAKKLSVSVANTRLGDYSREPFDQGHLPSSVYQKGKWRSYTTND